MADRASLPHGTILGGTSTVPNVDDAIRAYHGVLGLDLVETGEVPKALAQSWGCPATTGSRYAILRPKSGAPCLFRLVEQEQHPDFVPTTTYGWASFECAVEDARYWRDRLPADLFEVRGLPKTPGDLEPTFIAMQTLGPGGEMLYLNQALSDPDDTELARAQSPIDRIFIAVLAAQDRKASIDWYRRHLDLDHVADHNLPYSTINRAFGHSAETLTTLSMMHRGKIPVVEIDGYPDEAKERPQFDGMLPPGNALVTLAVADLDACDMAWITDPNCFDGPVYQGRRSATAVGAAGELIECIEVGKG